MGPKVYPSVGGSLCSGCSTDHHEVIAGVARGLWSVPALPQTPNVAVNSNSFVVSASRAHRVSGCFWRDNLRELISRPTIYRDHATDEWDIITPEQFINDIHDTGFLRRSYNSYQTLLSYRLNRRIIRIVRRPTTVRRIKVSNLKKHHPIPPYRLPSHNP